MHRSVQSAVGNVYSSSLPTYFLFLSLALSLHSIDRLSNNLVRIFSVIALNSRTCVSTYADIRKDPSPPLPPALRANFAASFSLRNKAANDNSATRAERKYIDRASRARQTSLREMEEVHCKSPSHFTFAARAFRPLPRSTVVPRARSRFCTQRKFPSREKK